jgi:wyosine [tRNA(Phe)-imidazoG37] synthetase (radical SAM superfamily)
LGIDMLLQTSICSFNCIYCQLGDIQLKTLARQIYVPTDKIERDFKNSPWQQADIVTFSGSGEPTLALNLGEAIQFVKAYAKKPVMVLTNATLLHEPTVQQDLMHADVVAAKLDAGTEAGLHQMNRPVAGVTLAGILSGLSSFRAVYPGKLCLQCMWMPTNRHEAEAMIPLIQRIQPDEVQLNTPKRPYPRTWALTSRGNHTDEEDGVQRVALKTLNPGEATQLEDMLRAACPNVQIVSVYQPA